MNGIILSVAIGHCFEGLLLQCDVKVKWTQHLTIGSSKNAMKLFASNEVICKVHRLGDKNDQFYHVRYLMQDSNFM
jgi:hypothetical protein